MCMHQGRGGDRSMYEVAPTCCRLLQVPDVLAPLANTVTPIVENILATDLRRFATLAEQQEASAVM